MGFMSFVKSAGGGSILGGLGTALAGGLLSSAGSNYAARKQYEYSRRLRSTAYQDTMSDMKAAGLNPILAYQTGASSAPSINVGNPGQAAIEGAANAINSAQSAKLMAKQIQTVEEQGYAYQAAGNKDHALQNLYNQQADMAKFENQIKKAYQPYELEMARFHSRNPWMGKTRAGLSLLNDGVSSATAVRRLATPKAKPLPSVKNNTQYRFYYPKTNTSGRR